MHNQEYIQFQETVWEYYRQYGRSLPWRQPTASGIFDPYSILVSEIMLQQTQVSRVVPKYEAFIKQFPTFSALAKAPLAAVLRAWSGLGYNRRAQFLHRAAQAVEAQHETLPFTLESLVKLPGVGPNTAAAILVYAYSKPYVFIETNIRTVYIHHFFTDKDQVTDKELLPVIEATMDTEHPREWYWALMDYGTYLKTTVGNVSRSSKHYTKQSTFEGSNRKIRGAVLKLLAHKPLNFKQLMRDIDDNRLDTVLQQLCKEELIHCDESLYYLGP